MKAYLLGAALLITVLVGISRVYLGVHYPTDVVAGWTVGAVWAIGSWLIAQFITRRARRKGSGGESGGLLRSLDDSPVQREVRA